MTIGWLIADEILRRRDEASKRRETGQSLSSDEEKAIRAAEFLKKIMPKDVQHG